MRERQHGRVLRLTSRNHCYEDLHGKRSGRGQRHGSVETQRKALETNVEARVDDVRNQGNDGAIDLMFVGLAEIEGFVMGVKLRYEMQVAENTPQSGCKIQ